MHDGRRDPLDEDESNEPVTGAELISWPEAIVGDRRREQSRSRLTELLNNRPSA
jgi:hypothetical protein